MKLIKNITIDSKPIASAATTKQYTVTGDVGAVFSLTVTNEAGDFYNFSEELDKNGNLVTAVGFAAAGARLVPKTIGQSGVYVGAITFPTVTGDDVYSITMTAEAAKDTFLDSAIYNSNIHTLANIHQYLDTTITFSLSSAGSSGSYNTLPSNVTATSISSSVEKNSSSTAKTILWNVTLSASQFIIAKQPTISDFQFSTTKVSRTAGASTKKVEVTSLKGLSVGMPVSGTGIASNSVVTEITRGYLDANKSSAIEDVYVIPKAIAVSAEGQQELSEDIGGTITIDKSSTFNAGVTLTFVGKGSSDASVFNGTSFSFKNLLLTIDPVVTTTDAAVSNSKTIPITSTNGIKAADTILMSGIGVTAALPHVDTVNNNVSVVVSTNQTIENGQTMTFTGSSRSATITADLTIFDFGVDDITITLALDNILTVA